MEEIISPEGVGQSRQWVRLGFDGVHVANSLIDSIIVCDKEIDLSKEDFALHVQLEHPGIRDRITYSKVFDCVLLAIGARHTEMNLLRAVLVLLKHIFLDQVSVLLGFQSKRAQDLISRGSNHHMSWQVFLIFYTAFALQLMYMYVFVTEWLKDGKTPPVGELMIWKMKVTINMKVVQVSATRRMVTWQKNWASITKIPSQ